MNSPSAQSRFEPEVLLIFLGHSDDANAEADAILTLEHELQRELERLLQVMAGSPRYKKVRLWEWKKDAPAGVGG